MLLELNDFVDAGQIAERKKNRWLKEEDAGCFSLAVLVLLLHKYSSRLREDVFLKVQLARPIQDQKLELRYSIAEDQAFNSFFTSIKKDISMIYLFTTDTLHIEVRT